jgi:hypothetical protein
VKQKSTSRSAFLNLCVLLGLLAFIAGALLAVFAAPALGQIRRGEANPKAVIDTSAGKIGNNIVAGVTGSGSCQYTIAYTTNIIVPGNTDTGNHCAWCDTTINLPFPFALYDQTFSAVMVNSSGRLDFVCNNEPSNYTETCLPAPPNNCPYDYTIFALWGEWYTGTGATGCSTWANGCGVFTSVSGTAPNRIFNIEWHAVSREDDRLTANFEVRLYENSPSKRFDVIYGVIQQRSANFKSAGVQGPNGSFTQDFCNVPPPQNVSSTYTMPSCATPTPTATPTTMVTNTNDNGPGSLRQVLADAHDGGTINFDPALNGRNISLTSAELVIDKSIIINGPGPNLLGVYRSSETSLRIMHVMPAVTASIGGLTISNGDAGQQGGGGILNDHAILTIDRCAVQNSFASQSNSGGGVYNDGSGNSATLTISNSTISGNYAYFAGGGIYNDAYNDGSATLTITNSSVNNNSAWYAEMFASDGEGGGIYNGSGMVTITNSSVSDNYAGMPVSDPFPAGNGGGISNYGTLTIISSTISNNGCGLSGSGISNGGTLTIKSSTVTGNGANGEHDGQPWGRGGGISGAVTLTNSTLSANHANLSTGGLDGSGTIMNSTISGNNGGGISVKGMLEIGNTILNAGPSGPNIANNGGTITSHGYNLSSDDGGGYLTGPGDQINTDPLLGPLQNNGGPTLTHALLPGSPAINTGDPNFTPPPSYDQRGPRFRRVFNGRIDVGSFEAQPQPPPFPAPRPRPTPPPRPTPR